MSVCVCVGGYCSVINCVFVQICMCQIRVILILIDKRILVSRVGNYLLHHNAVCMCVLVSLFSEGTARARGVVQTRNVSRTKRVG